MKGGTLYPRLTALEAAGLVEIEWREGDGGPGRKYYRLTPNGRSTLVEAAAEFDRFTGLVESVGVGALAAFTLGSFAAVVLRRRAVLRS